MQTIESLLPVARDGARGIVIRTSRPGDMGRVVQRHGELYALERGYDATYEALVAEIVADFVRRFDPARHCCWMAERAGEVVGSIFIVRNTAGRIAVAVRPRRVSLRCRRAVARKSRNFNPL